MLKSNAKPGPVEAVLRVDMIVNGEDCAAGEVVELSAREFKCLVQYDRVAEATKENVAAVRAEVAKRKEAAARAAADPAAEAKKQLDETKSQLATAQARIAELEKKAK